MRILLIPLLVVFASSFASAQTTGNIRMGFVDLQKVVQGTTAGKRAKADLEAQFTKKKRELDAQEAKLRRLGQELETQKGKISEAAFLKRQAALEKQILEYRDFSGRTQIDFQAKEIEVTTPILEKIRRVITKVSKDNGYTVVMEKTAQVLHFPEGDDLTEKVIRDFEREK